MHSVQEAHQRLIDYLSTTYGVELFSAGGAVYPLFAYPLLPEQFKDVDSVLAPTPPHAFNTELAIYDSQHLTDLKRTRSQLTNEICYIFDRFDLNPLKMAGRLGYYFDMLATCDAIDQEIRRYVRGEQDVLPHREKLHEVISPADALYSGDGRCGVIGVATLTVFKQSGQYHAAMVRRSNVLGVDPGRLHIMPAFVFQPADYENSNEAEWSIRHHVLREFGEELFAMPEFGGKEVQPHDEFYSFPPVAELIAMLEDGRAELQLTGVILNLMTLRPEICTVLMIHDEDWYSRWNAELQAALFTERQETLYIPIDTLEGLPPDLHLYGAPQGMAAFWMGIEQARLLIR